MPKAQRFQDLQVWQKAHQFVLGVYRMTKTFPADERYGLVSQMRRAAVSVPANIAEGFKRRGQADKIRFYNMAETSLEEVKYYLILSHDLGITNEEQDSRNGRVKYYLILSHDLGYISEKEALMTEAETISRMLYRLIQAVDGRR